VQRSGYPYLVLVVHRGIVDTSSKTTQITSLLRPLHNERNNDTGFTVVANDSLKTHSDVNKVVTITKLMKGKALRKHSLRDLHINCYLLHSLKRMC